MKKEFDLSLYLVTDRTLCLDRDIVAIVEQAVSGGVTLVQLREKKADDKDIYDLAMRLKKVLGKYKVPLLINDRVDIAKAAGADGVHLGQKDMPVDKAREILGQDALIGLSVESVEQVQDAEQLAVDYIGISPVFSTPTKKDTITEWGIEGVRNIRNISKHKLVAIGGIKPANTAAIISAGADGIAVVSAICSADDPGKSAELFRKVIEESRSISCSSG